MLRRAGRWVWVPALACGVAGVCGLADLRNAEPAGRLLLLGPHAAGVALCTWAGRRRTVAGLVAVAGSAAMAGLSWTDALDRQTEGFEWRFNNVLQGTMCLGANYLVLAVVGCAAAALVDAPDAPPPDDTGRPDGANGGAEPGHCSPR